MFAFTATKTEFAARADEMKEKGVERLTMEEILMSYGILLEYEESKAFFTVIAGTQIVAETNEPITFQDIQVPVQGLLLWQSKVSSIMFVDCTLANLKDGIIQKGATSFYFFQSETSHFYIRRSTTGSFFVEQQSATDSFSLEKIVQQVTYLLGRKAEQRTYLLSEARWVTYLCCTARQQISLFNKVLQVAFLSSKAHRVAFIFQNIVERVVSLLCIKA